jgi:hypothetical protein
VDLETREASTASINGDRQSSGKPLEETT